MLLPELERIRRALQTCEEIQHMIDLYGIGCRSETKWIGVTGRLGRSGQIKIRKRRYVRRGRA